MRKTFCRTSISVAAFVVFSSLDALAAAQDRPLAADFPEVYRVGGFDAPEWAEFSDAPAVSFDADGRLYALDTSAGHVVVIDPSGALIRTVGRPGEGPGEFNQPAALVVWPEGRLAVADIGHNAFQIFGPDGEFERFIRMGSGNDVFSGMTNVRSRLRPDPAGLVLIAQGVASGFSSFTGALAGLLGGEAPNDGRVDDRGLERLHLAGEEVVAEMILEAWRPPTDADEVEDVSPSDLADASSLFGIIMGGERWFEPDLLWDLLPDGAIAYSDSSAYDIKLADRGGRVTRTLRRPLTPKPVTRRIRSAMRERELRSLEDGGGSGFVAGVEAGGGSPALVDQIKGAAREEIENRDFFEEIPVLSALRATWDGALWVQRRGEEPWDPLGPIDVMRADGEYVGTFATGATVMPNAFGPDRLVAFIELDEFDIPSIVVRRLPAEVR